MRLFQQDEASADKRVLFVQMVDENDFVTPETGLSLTVEIVKADEAAYAAIAGSDSEISSGTYKISLATADLDTLGHASVRVTATGAAAVIIPVEVVDFVEPVYGADIAFCVDDVAGQDEYTVAWFKNGLAIAGAATTLTVTKRDDSTLINAEAMSASGDMFTYDATDSERSATGDALLLEVTATIDGAARTASRLVFRDSETS